MNFRDFAELVLGLREKDGIRSVQSERDRFKKHLADCPLAKLQVADIKPVDIADFGRLLRNTYADDCRGLRLLSPATVRNILQLVDTVFITAIERGLRTDNPCAFVRKPRRTETAEDKWTVLTLEEQLRLAQCATIPEWGRCAMLFAAGSGLRQGEQWSLELRDVHLEGPKPHVFVRFGSKGLTPKNGRKRTVVLFGFALKALKRWLEIRPDHGSALVFPTLTGERRQKGAPKQFKKWLKAAGIERNIRWHDLRHTCASSLATGIWSHRWNLVDIRNTLGHSSVRVTEMYSHVGDEGAAQAAVLTGGDLC